MKKILFIILLCLNIQLTYGTTFNSASSIYGRDRGVSTSEYRIGYTSQYGDGFSNNKSTFGYPRNTYINHKSTFGKTTYDNYHSNAIYPGNTYDNYHSNYSSGGGRPGGQPRRVRGYDDNGNYKDTDGQGNPSDPSKGMWKDGYEYYYEDGYWYRTKDGKNWEKWSSYFDLGWLAWNWYPGRPHSGNATHYQQNNPVPIGDGLVPLSLLCLGYILYRRRSNFFV